MTLSRQPLNSYLFHTALLNIIIWKSESLLYSLVVNTEIIIILVKYTKKDILLL